LLVENLSTRIGWQVCQYFLAVSTNFCRCPSHAHLSYRGVFSKRP
jgi:hypothetical protein